MCVWGWSEKRQRKKKLLSDRAPTCEATRRPQTQKNPSTPQRFSAASLKSDEMLDPLTAALTASASTPDPLANE